MKDFSHVIIDQHVNTSRCNNFYNEVLTIGQRKRFEIFEQKCYALLNIKDTSLDEFESKVVSLFMMRHYFML